MGPELGQNPCCAAHALPHSSTHRTSASARRRITPTAGAYPPRRRQMSRTPGTPSRLWRAGLMPHRSDPRWRTRALARDTASGRGLPPRGWLLLLPLLRRRATPQGVLPQTAPPPRPTCPPRWHCSLNTDPAAAPRTSLRERRGCGMEGGCGPQLTRPELLAYSSPHKNLRRPSPLILSHDCKDCTTRSGASARPGTAQRTWHHEQTLAVPAGL